MKILKDFHCEKCAETFEFWYSKGTPNPRCSKCGAFTASIISGGNFSLPGTDTGFPTAADKWARRHRNANKANLKELGLPV